MSKLTFKIYCLFLFISAVAEARQRPPAPYATPPPGLSIDSNLILLLISLFLFGTYKIYKKQKTSI